MRTLKSLGFVVGLLAVLGATSCGGEPAGDETAQTTAALKGGHCGPHIKACTAAQVGQPCSPDNLSVLCSAQASGAYCCLAYAP